MRARVLTSLLTFVAASGGLLAHAGVARAEASDPPAMTETREISAGMHLVAVSDVTLRRAALSKGARVNVTRVGSTKGRVTTVDVELADGHVLKRVAVDEIRKSFAVADESKD